MTEGPRRWRRRGPGRRQLRAGRPQGGGRRRRRVILRWLAGCAITSGSWRGREEEEGGGTPHNTQTTPNPSAEAASRAGRGCARRERQPRRGQPRGARQPPQPVRTPGPGGERGLRSGDAAAACGGWRPGTCAAGAARSGAGCRGVAVPRGSRGWSRLRARLSERSAPKAQRRQPGAPLTRAGGLGEPGSGLAPVPSRPVPRVVSSLCVRLFLTSRSASSCGGVGDLPQLGGFWEVVGPSPLLGHTLRVDVISLLARQKLINLAPINLRCSQNALLSQNASLSRYVLFCS